MRAKKRSRDESTNSIAKGDIERTLEMNAATLACTGAILALTVNRRFAWISAVVTGFLFQHALQGWCPPVPMFRKRGVRTAREINQEKTALRILRGDFQPRPMLPKHSDKHEVIHDAPPLP